MKIIVLSCFAVLLLASAGAQNADQLIRQLKSKMERVNSYEADGIMKTNVSFLKLPESNIKIYFRKPDKLRIKNEKGISLVPKTLLGISLQNLLNGNFTVLDAGTVTENGLPLRILKLVPAADNPEIILSTLYIDVQRLLIMKSRITTKENGTYEMNMQYGKHSDDGLPDRITCTFNTRQYKLPKGVTLDYDDGSSKKNSGSSAPDTEGEVEIIYRSYEINKAIPDSVF